MPTETEQIEQVTEEAPISTTSKVSERFAKLMAGESPEQLTPKTDDPKPEPVKPNPDAKPEGLEKLIEIKPALDDAPPGNVVGKAAESWNSFKAKANKEIAARESRIAELQREVETAKKTAQPMDVTKAPEFEELRKQRDEMDSHLKTIAIERHPEFVKYFNGKTKAAIEAAKNAVGAELAPHVEKILMRGDTETRSEDLENLAVELSPFKQGELANAVGKLREVEAERAAEIEKAGKSYETLQGKTKAEQEQYATEQKALSAHKKNEALTLARLNMDAFKIKDGDDLHNTNVKQNEEFVSAFFDGTLDPKLLPAVPVLAAEAMYLRQTTLPALQAELKKRDDIIAGYQGSQPKLETGSNNTRTESDIPEGGRFLAKFRELYPGK